MSNRKSVILASLCGFSACATEHKVPGFPTFTADQLPKNSFLVTIPPRTAVSNLVRGIECELHAQAHQVVQNSQAELVEISVVGATLGDYSELKVLVRPAIGGSEIQVTSSIVTEPLMRKLTDDAEHQGSCKNT